MAEMVTRQELIDAKRDARDLGKAVNEKTIVSPRYGVPFKSIPMVVADLQSAINTIIVDDGIPALVVVDETGRSQQEINNSSTATIYSMTDLRNYKRLVHGSIIYLAQHTADVRGGGFFRYNSFSSTSDDNGVHIKPNSISGNGRWIRIYTSLRTDDFALYLRSDDVTPVLQLMNSLADEIIVNDGEYLISDFRPSKKYIFEDGAWFKTNTTARSNGIIAQTGLKMIKPKIKHNVAVAPVDGDFGNAIRIGTYRQANDLNVSVHDVEIYEPEIQLLSTTRMGQGFEILGNTYDIVITRPKIYGKGFGIIAHWGGDVADDGHLSTVTYSYHPHNIKIIDPDFSSTSTDATGRMQTGLILSACYDVEVTNIKSDGLMNTAYLFVGDVHNQVSVSRDKDKVCTGIKVDGVTVDNFVDGASPIQLIGYSATIRTAVGMTTALDDNRPFQMEIKGVKINSRNQSNTSDLIRLLNVKNVELKATILGTPHTGKALSVENSNNCDIDVAYTSRRGVLIKGVHDSDFRLTGNNIVKDIGIFARGVTFENQNINVTESQSASIGAETVNIRMSYSTLIYKGMLLEVGGKPIAKVTKSALCDGVNFTTIHVTPLLEDITLTTGVSLNRINTNCNVYGSISGYYNNVYATNPRGFSLYADLQFGYNSNLTFDGNLLENVKIANSSSYVGTYNTSAKKDYFISSSRVSNLSISTTFDGNQINPKSQQRIEITTDDHNGVKIFNCSGTVCASTIPINIKPSIATRSKQQAQIYANSFDDVNTVVSAAYSGMYVGNTYNGFVRDTAPSSGFWRVGDRLLRENAVVGQPSGWVCTVGGSSPTWTPLAAV